jgi:hypothetical protein
MDRLREDEALKQRIFPGYSGTTFTDMQIGQEVNLVEYEKLIDEQLTKYGFTPESTPDTVTEPVPEIEDAPAPTPSPAPEETPTVPEPEEEVEIREASFQTPQPERTIDPEIIKRETDELIKEFDKLGFMSFFSGKKPGYDGLLKNMTMGEVRDTLLSQRPEVALSRHPDIDGESLAKWINGMNRWTKDVPLVDSESTRTYLNRVAEHYYTANGRTSIT